MIAVAQHDVSLVIRRSFGHLCIAGALQAREPGGKVDSFEAELYCLTKEEGGRHTPFFSDYRPQLFIRTADVTGARAHCFSFAQADPDAMRGRYRNLPGSLAAVATSFNLPCAHQWFDAHSRTGCGREERAPMPTCASSMSETSCQANWYTSSDLHPWRVQAR